MKETDVYNAVGKMKSPKHNDTALETTAILVTAILSSYFYIGGDL